METKKQLESYYLLNIVLPQLISNKEAEKEDFVNILNVLIKNNKFLQLEEILSKKQNKLKRYKLLKYVTKKEYNEQLDKIEQQIKELKKEIKEEIEVIKVNMQKHRNINFEGYIIENNKLQIIFRRQFLTDYFNYNGFVEAIKEIGENFNGVEVSFKECTIEQKMFDKIFRENAINHNYTTQDDKEINIYFKNLDLQNVDLTKFTLENLEVLKDEELLSKNCLFKGCKLNFELLKIITKERFEKYMMFFGRGGNVCKILDFLDFKHLNFEQLKEIENLLPVDNLSVNTIPISTNCLEEIINGKTVFGINSENMFDKVRNFEDFATSMEKLFDLIKKIINIKGDIDYLIKENGKLVELFGKIRYVDYHDLKRLIEFFIEKEEFKERFIDYLFEKDGLVKLFEQINEKDKMDLINLIKFFIEKKEFKERFIDYLIKENGKLVELFGKMGCYANYPNLKILIKFFIEKEEFKERFIDYLFEKDGLVKFFETIYINIHDLNDLIRFFIEKKEFKERFIDYLFEKDGLVILFEKADKKNASKLIILIKFFINEKELKERFIQYLFKENQQSININKLFKKNFQSKYNYCDFLIKALCLMEQGVGCLFEENGKNFDELIKKYNSLTIENFLHMINILSSKNAVIPTKTGEDGSIIEDESYKKITENTEAAKKETKEYLFGENGKFIELFIKVEEKSRTYDNLIKSLKESCFQTEFKNWILNNNGISEIVNQLDNNYIFGILNEEQFNFSLEEKQQIIKKTYKILKNKGNFNKDDFIKKFSKIKIKKFKINKKILEQWDEEIEKNKPIYKFINNEDYSKNIEGFINDCRKELEDIKLDKKYIDIVVNYIEKLKKEKQESSKLKQISNILKNISSEIEEKSEFKKISNCLTAYEELKI